MHIETAPAGARPGQFLLSLIRSRQPRRPRQPADMSSSEIVALAEAEAGLDAGDGTLVDRVRRVLVSAPFLPPQFYAARSDPAIASLLDAARDDSDRPVDVRDDHAGATGLILDPVAYAAAHANQWGDAP
jgi:hypothetical protein